MNSKGGGKEGRVEHIALVDIRRCSAYARHSAGAPKTSLSLSFSAAAVRACDGPLHVGDIVALRVREMSGSLSAVQIVLLARAQVRCGIVTSIQTSGRNEKGFGFIKLKKGYTVSVPTSAAEEAAAAASQGYVLTPVGAGAAAAAVVAAAAAAAAAAGDGGACADVLHAAAAASAAAAVVAKDQAEAAQEAAKDHYSLLPSTSDVYFSLHSGTYVRCGRNMLYEYSSLSLSLSLSRSLSLSLSFSLFLSLSLSFSFSLCVCCFFIRRTQPLPPLLISLSLHTLTRPPLPPHTHTHTFSFLSRFIFLSRHAMHNLSICCSQRACCART